MVRPVIAERMAPRAWDVSRREEIEGDSPKPEPEPAVRTEEEQAVALRDRRDERQRQHDHEARDTPWATRVESELGNALSAVAERGGFSLGDVECRSTSCTASIRWPSFVASREGAQLLARLPLETACRRTMLLPAPEEGSDTAAYEARVFFSCAREQ
jgi:hypothetical protein